MYKKIATTFLCATVLGSGLYAENKPFIGLEVGYATVQGDVSGFFPGDIIRDYEGSDVEYGFRLGLQNESWRTTLVFNYFDSTSDGHKQNYEKGLISVDYFILNEMDNPLKPYIGANVGYINYESTDNIDMSGAIYGAQAGFVYSMTDNIDLDLMYRYSLSSATQDDRDASLDHVGSVVIGLNFEF
jgi:opacity protein-like surface antigen